MTRRGTKSRHRGKGRHPKPKSCKALRMAQANGTKHDPDTCDACRKVAELTNAAEVRELENPS